MTQQTRTSEAGASHDAPVAIVGGGPVGLMLALFLDRHGVRSVVFNTEPDVRPHPNFGTVELRVCDGMPTLYEVGAVTALFQALVQRMDRQLDDGYELPMPREWIVRENKWRSARYGMDAEVIVNETGRTELLRESLLELVEELGPVARRLGCDEELSRVPKIMERGASHVRQREVVAAGGSLKDVVDSLLNELEADQFSPRREPLDGPVPGPLPPSVPAPILMESRPGE